MKNIRIILRDANQMVVEDRVLAPLEAAQVAASFVLLHGGDPDEDGRGAQSGSLEFEPTNDAADPGDDDEELDSHELIYAAVEAAGVFIDHEMETRINELAEWIESARDQEEGLDPWYADGSHGPSHD